MYSNLEECIIDLENNGHLVRIKEQVDPYLEMAMIHLKVYQSGGPALLFENVKGSKYPAVSNLFGTIERSKFIFRKNWNDVKDVIELRNDPKKILKNPIRFFRSGFTAMKAIPMKKSPGLPSEFEEIEISDLPFIQNWPGDGGAFITLPQVYSEDPEKPGIMHANVGMYRVQLNGNDYELNKEIGLHYQIHRGIGVHQAKANKKGEPLKISIFVGGPPAHTLAAVMPLPEGLSEGMFAGMLAGRRFRYRYEEGYCISCDADFVITGQLYPEETKPEGPFGDHLGYYSLKHDFPVMKINKVYARKNAIWPFTVVGRPPQEDTSFGMLIHELTGKAIQKEIPGVKEVHAVDAAGVHPLLLAIGSERYTPYQQVKQPAELLTIANRILGTGQLSLAKYLFITADESQPLNTHNVADFLMYILERINLHQDIHFQTNTTIDTLDYSGTGLNTGSKVIFAACGEKKRELCKTVPTSFKKLTAYSKPRLVLPGVVAIQGPLFSTIENAVEEIRILRAAIEKSEDLSSCPMILLCDDTDFISESLDNFLWVTFTRSNPSHDIYGVNEFYQNKHWGCDNLIIDVRIKPHHAPILIEDSTIVEKVDRFFNQLKIK